jgi:glycosyltransferase involved in cell wall biosynthesis
MNVKYCGPARDYSGYGEANRHDIAALAAAGVEVTTQIPHYCMEISDFGRLGDLAGKNENRKLDYKIKIIHTTPNVYGMFFEPGIYHIGRVFWETDKLPLDFSEKVQLCDEIWTGSEFNKQAIINSGVTKPIYIIPEAIDTYLPDIQPYKVPNSILFNFYSIFEWTERKNPTALLEAYWREFENESGVGLVLKTYVDNFSADKKSEIHSAAREVKARLGLKNYAPIYFYTNLMDRHQVYRFHKTFDCFVSAHRGEGWGIPQMEAMLMGKPIISTNCGGIHEYLTDGVDAKLLPCSLVKLHGNTRNQQWYSNDQKWADIEINDLRKAMRWVFDHRKEAQEMGKKAHELVEKKFSLEVVGTLMTKRLYKISHE